MTVTLVQCEGHYHRNTIYNLVTSPEEKPVLYYNKWLRARITGVESWWTRQCDAGSYQKEAVDHQDDAVAQILLNDHWICQSAII